MLSALILLACGGPPEPCARPLDTDCDGAVDDLDGDGSPADADCDDEEPLLHVRDDDGDGWTTCQDDCDDVDPARGPRGVVAERCDDVDNDCNDLVDVDDLGASACRREVRLEVPRLTQNDVLLIVHRGPSARPLLRELQAQAPAIGRRLAGTDTHLAVAATSPPAGTLLDGTEDDPYFATAGRTAEEIEDWLQALLDPARTYSESSEGAEADVAYRVARDVLIGASDAAAEWRRAQAGIQLLFVSPTNQVSEVPAFELDAVLQGVEPGEGSAKIDIFPWHVPDAVECAGVSPGLAYDDLDELRRVHVASYCDAGPGVRRAIARRAPDNEVGVVLPELPIVVTLGAELHLADRRVVTLGADAVTFRPADGEAVVAGYRWDELDPGERSVVFYEVVPEACDTASDEDGDGLPGCDDPDCDLSPHCDPG